MVSITLKEKLNFDIIKALIIGSPGFTKDGFKDYINQLCNKNNAGILKDNL
jgi:stalled ribosome rescue protein Dom34